MPASIEKTYSDALFSLIIETNGEKSDELTNVLKELESVNNILIENPDFTKLMSTPTVSKEEKAEILNKSFNGKLSEITYNFMRVLADKHRFGYFGSICEEYRRTYNDTFGITEITVTTTDPLSDDLRQKIIAKMSTVTKKTVILKEKVDKTLIGGIVLDYGNTRLDGSIKTKLEALKKDISGIIA